ncbi:MAG: serine O-acetyltransferase [Hyphomicrobiales bacterium]|nr:serine O-acetyltransferase [Hyphomicrobiales bacterium]
MAQPQQLNGDVNVKAYDPLWEIIRSEAHESMRIEPLMASFLFANVLSHDTLRDAVTHRVAQRLGSDDIAPALVRQIFSGVLEAEPSLPEAFRADLAAVYERDPACQRHIDPLLYFKGFHALQTHRFAHWLHNNGRRDFALYLQSQSSRVFGVDIHPAAKIGRGLMFDHATGIVIGETATIGDNTSLLHGVTLGGSGKETGDRHPKIGSGVMVGAGAKVLGNIKVGDCARIASGSVVLKDVPPKTTVAGVPARVVGHAGCSQPARTMDQTLGSLGSSEE